jgi:linoleoyl-CoA desaturase
MGNVVLPKFKSAAGSNFSRELRTNVENYFRQSNISKFANSKLKRKAAVLLITFFGTYILVLTLGLPLWSLFLLCIVMGLSKAGIGMGVMHDANHGSFSKKPLVNKIFGKSADVLGVSSNNWINQHNKLHHTYTNIHGHDEDVDGKGLFRFTPDAPHRKIHKFQHFYWTIFYGFLTLGWFFADAAAYKKYRDRGLNKSTGAKKRKEIAEIIFFKLFYISYMFVLPMLVMDVAWWHVILGVLTVEFTAGMILSVIFQMAHVVDKFDLSNHDKFDGETKDEWTVHQIKNTFDFAVNNKIITWYCGGLNFQVEHHLFPNISHAHYPNLYKIVKETAKKYNVDYQEFNTFREAFRSHLTFLRKLGRPALA